MKIQAMTKSEQQGQNVMRLCQHANIPRSSYYSFFKHNKIEQRDKVIYEAILQLPEKDAKRGYRIKAKLLKNSGMDVSNKQMWRICNKFGLLSTIRKRKHPKDYYVKHRDVLKETVVENILKRQFKSSQPLKKLCTDITYVKVKNGWLFLSVIIDLCTKEIVSYICSRRIDAKLVTDTVQKLKEVYPDIKNCILHSDQGTTYTSVEFKQILKESGFVQSMSRKGNCYDNAIVENFFGTFKNESIYKETLKKGKLKYKEMKLLITEFIDYYNNKRIQEGLEFLSPSDFKIKTIAKKSNLQNE